MNLGIVGWRGMVGSVLINRMNQNNDFGLFNTTLLSSSNFKSKLSTKYPNLKYEKSDKVDCLMSQDIIVSCQGSEYTEKIYPTLRKKGWSGYWVDAASSLRMDEDSIIVLDPLNKKKIINYINNNGKTFCGGNCTVSLLLLAIQGLIDSNLLSWVSSMTYQSVSGAGASSVKELLMQMSDLSNDASINVDDDTNDLLDNIDLLFSKKNLTTKFTQIPLIGNLIPWIDSDLDNGQSREEWKGGAEANKILNNKNISFDGICTRVGVFRCHSQALTFSLKEKVDLDVLNEKIGDANEWVKVVSNNKSDTLNYLNPVKVSSNLKILIGRLRKLNLPGNIYSAFTIGDQLLWGAAEPLRRTALIIKDSL